MKKIKRLKGFTICELTEEEKNDSNISTCNYILVNNEQMEYESSMRDVEFESDNINELIDFLK